MIALQVEVNSGGNVYFCFCSGHVGREQDEGDSHCSEGSPERCHADAWDERGWHTSISPHRMPNICSSDCAAEDSWPEPQSAIELQRRAASDDSAVRQLVDVLQAAADDDTPADDRPAATSSPDGGSRCEAVPGRSNDMDLVASPSPTHGLPPPPSTTTAACSPGNTAEGNGAGIRQQARGLQQSCQQDTAQSQLQPNGPTSQDDSLSQTAANECSDECSDANEAVQLKPTNGNQCQPHTLQRQHSGSAPPSPNHQHPPDRLLVVKFLPARLDAQSEQFASELARHLGVPSPACRILRKQVG
jgi:hypothetical protein